MKKTSVCILSSFFFLLCVNLYAARYYVKPEGDDSSSGTTWLIAFATLTKASSVAQDGDEVWVAGGTFQEGTVITIPQGVSFYGGFTGTETQLSERDIESNKTIIDGNNSYRCVINYGLIDGFYITKGRLFANEYGAGIYNINGTVNNCMVYANRGSRDGGGIYNNFGSITNCTINDNILTESWDYITIGGGVYNSGNMTNCAVFGNIANWGGCI